MAQVLVQNRVSLALPVIPALVQNEGISVKKMSPSTMMIVNLLSPDGRYDNTFLSNYATIYIKDELGRLPGVAGITYLGQRDYSLRAWLDPAKMAALGLSATDIINAISQQNLQVAAGQIGQQPVPRGQQFQLTINTLGRLVEPEQFERHHPQGGRRHVPGDDVRRRHRRRRRRGEHQRRHGADGRDRPGLPGRRDRPGRLEQPGRDDVAGHRDRPAPRRRPGRAGLAAIRPVVHPRRQAVGGDLHLPVARLQRSRDRQGRLRQDARAQGPVPRRPRLQDRLRHHAVHPGVDQRGLSTPSATPSSWSASSS